jgi:hypothetical protein
MKKIAALCLAIICIAALTGCVSRDQADAKLAKACAAGVNVFLQDGQQIDKIVESRFTPSPVGQGFRHVTLVATVKNDWLEQNHTYECDFQEDFGFMKTNYSASIEKLDAEGIVIGRAGGEILGDAQDFIKLTDAIRKALYE